jgi:hypothetical protein
MILKIVIPEEILKTKTAVKEDFILIDSGMRMMNVL